MSESNTQSEGGEPWDTVTADVPSFEDFVGHRASAVVIHDEQLRKRGQHARAQLRSLPLFRDFGFETVVHTNTWSDRFKLIDYTHVATEDVGDRIDDIEFPLVHVVTQEGINKYGDEMVVWELLRRAIEERERYILVADTVAPKLPTKIPKAGKAIPDHFADVIIRDYKDMVTRYIKEYYESALPLAVTRNPYFHRVSEYHNKRGAPAGDLEDLFNYTQAPPKSPVWEPLYYFLRHDLDAVLEGLSERIREALRSWIERGDTQRIASRMYDTMQRNSFSEAELDTFRTRDPSLR